MDKESAPVKTFPARHVFPSEKLVVFKRVLNEIEQVNNDFHTLRTTIVPDPEQHINLFYFVMIPNDGVMAHSKLVGRMIIPNEYPDEPPVLHLFNETRRYNVDVYRYRINGVGMSSSMCFDILRSKRDHGTWDKNFTISCLFASLMQSLVSMSVEQEHGGDVQEFVTMEKLAWVEKEVKRVFNMHSKYFDKLPQIPLIYGVPCYAKTLEFPKLLSTNLNQTPKIYSSNPFFLQTDSSANNVTFSLDLSNLTENIVFSVVLSNSKEDMIGSKSNTILVRNGVTGSAAKKRKGEEIKWFYHGIPLNRGDLKLTITVANNQFTMVYWEGDKPIIHGDTPISYLGVAEIGDVSRIPFYLNIFLKKKSGGAITITSFETESGFIHNNKDDLADLADEMSELKISEKKDEKFNIKSWGDIGDDDHDEKPILVKLHEEKPKVAKVKLTHLPLYVSLKFTPDATQYLRDLLSKYENLESYPVVRGHDDPAHVTLVFSSDMPLLDYHNVVADDYHHLQGTQVEIQLVGYARDNHCIAYRVELPIPVYPKGKFAHITMALNGKRPMYSNELIQRLVNKGISEAGEKLVDFDTPIKISGELKFEKNLVIKKNKLPWM
jgi:ubiquitin-protein ligase